MRNQIAVALLCALCGTGCATVTRGASQSWSVQTDPVGADVRLSSGETCKTPCTIKKRRKHPFTVDISLDGYQSVKTDIVSSMTAPGGWAMAGNAIVGGLVGLGVDAGIGAARDLSPNPLVVKLAPMTVVAPVAADASPSGEPATASDGGASSGEAVAASNAAESAAAAPTSEPAPEPTTRPSATQTGSCASCDQIGKNF